MTLEELQARIDKLSGEPKKAYIFRRAVEPHHRAQRMNGCGKIEIWVKTSHSDSRWGGGPTLEAALTKAVDALEFYEARDKEKR